MPAITLAIAMSAKYLRQVRATVLDEFFMIRVASLKDMENAGPSGQIEGLYPVINPETKIINILTKDGICYVNLDSSFLTVVNNVSTEVAVYSIVNSLVELDNINKVQILVNGEVPSTFSNSTFERNLDYVTTLEQ